MLANHLIPYSGLRRALHRRRGGHPFALFDREVEELFDRALRGFAPPADPDAGRTAWLSPRLDLREGDDGYTVTAELPGLDEKELKVELSDGYLTIEGEKKAERGDDKGDFRIVERSFGTFKRGLQVPADVDVEGIDAAFRNGVLTVALPKKEEAKATVRKIAVKAA